MPQQLNLLSLDGGGVKGLSSLYILQKLMEEINPDDPPKPCDCFDMIGGTSTGGYENEDMNYVYRVSNYNAQPYRDHARSPRNVG